MELAILSGIHFLYENFSASACRAIVSCMIAIVKRTRKEMITMITGNENSIFDGMTDYQVSNWIDDVMNEYGLCVTDTDFYHNGITFVVESGNTFHGVDVVIDVTRDCTEAMFYEQVGTQLTGWNAKEWCGEHIIGAEDAYEMVHDADEDESVFHDAGESMLARYRELR